AFRDRRTMLNVVLLPMILMPLVISLPTLMLSPKTIPPKIMVVVEDPRGMDLAKEIEALENSSEALVSIVTDGGNYTGLVLSGDVDLIVDIPEGFYENLSSGKTGRLIYYYDPYGARSSVAMGVVQRVVSEYSEEVLRRRLEAINLSEEYIKPIVSVAVQVTSTGEGATTGEVVTAMVLPMMVGLIAITGAGTFAIDMIAGERERKTLEALFTNPVSRGQLLLGKFGALTLLSLISGLATLFSALIGVGFAITSMSESLAAGSVPQLMEPSRLLYLTLGILITVALGGLTGNAVMITAASFAKTFKEAQQYVGFLTLILVVPMVAIPYAPQSFHPVL
ncbi:MAG: ABC transporter permease subunit, partial [Candidatus Korarchaeota archaeon]|nr:ABC transporter permease subunit [Candidatus Korarchaeota archaeon]